MFFILGSLVSIPAELSEENLSKQSSLYSVGNKLSQKSLPLIVEEKVPNSSSSLAPQGRDTRRKSVAARKASHNSVVTNTEELRDDMDRLAPHNANEERASATSTSLSHLQPKLSSFSAFASAHKSNRAGKRQEVCSLLIFGYSGSFVPCFIYMYVVVYVLHVDRLRKDCIYFDARATLE